MLPISVTRNSTRALALTTSALVAVAATGVVSARRARTYDLITHDAIARSITRPFWTKDWLDRVGEAILPLLDPGDTEYSSGYREETFLSIFPGTAEEEVASALGPPFLKKSFSEPLMREAFPEGSSVWYYSHHGPASKSYFVRAIEFDGRGRVVRKLRGYYVH
jgi:hypothetical protein